MPRVVFRNRLDGQASGNTTIAVPVGSLSSTGLALTVGQANFLYVNSSTGNDSRTKAQARSGSTPWLTIGRAAWGSTNRAAPNASEAADAGDTVLITAGTYSWAGLVDDRFNPVYNPVNSGTAGNYITFQAVGQVILGAPGANSPVIGSYDKHYIKWFADISAGSNFLITCDPTGGATPTTSSDPTLVNTKPDTGPVLVSGATDVWIEGCIIDGGVPCDYDDQYNMVRYNAATRPILRNNIIRNVHKDTGGGDATTVNQSCVTMYYTQDAIIEHNLMQDAGGGVVFKDVTEPIVQFGNHVRLNWFDGVDRGFVWSLTTGDRNFLYQNVLIGGAYYGMKFIQGRNDWIFNNTFVNIAGAGMSLGATDGARVWNNIFYNCGVMVLVEGGTMAPDTNTDLEHNLYYLYSDFYEGTDGSRTFANYKATYTDQDQVSPVSVDSDPLFVNAAGEDFRLQAGSPALNRGIDIGDLDGDLSTTDPVHAGAYLTGDEIIGLES